MDSPLITAIYIAAAIVGIAGGLLGIFVFIRQRQFARPTLEFHFGWHSPPKEISKTHRKPITIFAIAPKRELQVPLLAVLNFRLRNPGPEPLRNVRIAYEFGNQYLVSNEMFASLVEFKPTVISELSDSKTATLIQPSVTKDEMKKALESRRVHVFEGRAQVTFDLPLIRPGEWYMLYDLLLLPGSGPHDIRKLGFGAPGFCHIHDMIRVIPNLLDYLVVNFFVRAENHEEVNRKVSVLRFTSEEDSDRALKLFVEALWLGKLPDSGMYLSNGLLRRLRYKRGQAGRPSREIFRNELGLIRYSVVAETETIEGSTLMWEVSQRSDEAVFTLSAPNCDYFNLPAHVNDFMSLMKWLYLPTKPVLSRFKRFKEAKSEP